MNYLLVNYEYPPMGGGAGNATWFLARAWARQSHRVTVMTARHRDLPHYEDCDGVEVVRIPSLRRRFFEASILEMASFMVSGMALGPSLAKSGKIDRVVVFFTIPCGPIGYVLKKRLGLPYLLLQRGGDVPGFEPKLDRMHKFLAPIRRRLLDNASAVVANDLGLADLSKKADPLEVSVVPNGVDTDFWMPASEKRAQDRNGPLRFLAVGRLVAQKNMFYLLEEFARMVNGHKTERLLTIVGDGPDRQGLENLTSQLGLQNRVSWRGWLSKEELREEYRKADCLLNPSLYEGMPNVVLEAMACGVPAVVSNVPGNNTLVAEIGRAHV